MMLSYLNEKKKNRTMSLFTTNFASVFIWILAIIFCLAVVLLIDQDNSKPDYYSLLYLLPLSFAILLIAFFPIILKANTTIVVTIFLFYIRNVITPFIMFLGGYKGSFKILTETNVNQGIQLMIYETICVFFSFLLIKKNKGIKGKRFSTQIESEKNKKKFQIVGIAKISILFAALLFIITYVFVPEFRLSFQTIFSAEVSTNVSSTDSFVRGSILRIICVLSLTLFPLTELVLVLQGILFIKNKLGENILSVSLSIIIAFVPCLLMTEENALAVVIVLIAIILILNLYTNYRRIIILVVSALVIGMFVLILLVKTDNGNNESTFSALSKFMQAYFPGVCNFAGIFNINNPDKTSTLFFDFYSMIPFRNTLFGLSGDRLVIIYAEQNNALTSLLPCSGQVYHYLGFFLSPIISVFIVLLSNHYEKMFSKSRDVLQYVLYLFVFIFTVTTPIMYNLTIFGNRFFILLLPIVWIAHHSNEFLPKGRTLKKL